MKETVYNHYMRLLLLLTFITLFAGFLRFYNLSNNPPSLNLDEVAIGYNAYSILKTGMDEYGTSFPIAFRSHDDYKAPLYIYASILPVWLFGLNEFAVRFWSALLGTLTVPLAYFLTLQLFPQHHRKFLLAALVATFLAISPWHIQYSRAAFETNVAVFFICLGIWAYLKGKTQPKYWYLTATAFALSLYTYHSAKMFLPLFTLVLIAYSWKKIKGNLRFSLSVAMLFLVLITPLIPFSLSPEGRLRFKGTSVFETPTMVQANHDYKLEQWRQGKEYTAKVFHNEFLAGFQVFLKGYFSHFSYEFLFHESGPPKSYTPNVGLLYLWELPLIIAGLYSLFRYQRDYRYLLVSWILFVPIASGLTWDVPSSTRTTIILPTFQILGALGVVRVYEHLSHVKKHIAFSGILVFLVLFFFGHYLHNYHRIAPVVHSDAWQYGYKEAALYAQSQIDTLDKVIVSTELKQPQNFFAFYTAYDPATYIRVDGGTRSGGYQETGNAFGKYEFRPIKWNEEDLEPNVLYIDLAEFVDDRFVPIHQVNLLNGEPKLVMYIKPQ